MEKKHKLTAENGDKGKLPRGKWERRFDIRREMEKRGQASKRK
jgi:hypothetical protein